MLKKIWTRWRQFGKWMGDQVGRGFLILFYFTVALPFGLLVRLTQDPLDVRHPNSAGWVKRETKDRTLADARRSF